VLERVWLDRKEQKRATPLPTTEHAKNLTPVARQRKTAYTSARGDSHHGKIAMSSETSSNFAES